MKNDDSILLARGGSKGLFFRKVPYIIKYIYKMHAFSSNIYNYGINGNNGIS